MKFINVKTRKSKEELLSIFTDNDRVNKNVAFDDKRGTPYMHVKENAGKLKIKCEYVGGASKDNAFIDGTCFRGKITEKDGYTHLTGVITTALIFHMVLLVMFSAFVAVCIVKKGFSIVPLCLVVFDIFMYKDEFKKQGVIEKYIYRAVKKSDREKTASIR